jgi:plasmid maintenance system antidote protein VapI
VQVLQTAERPASDRGAVLTRAALNAAERLGLSGRELAQALGVSEPTISRMRNGAYILEERTKPFELAALLVRLFRSLDAITGGDETVARAWMRAENTALEARPVDRIPTITGLIDVVQYLDARRATL